MTSALLALSLTALIISFLHTISGPDHYLPFIVLSKSRKWSKSQTIMWTVICGFGHVISSLILGFIGLLLGWELQRISIFQEMRGSIATWGLFLFGFFYLLYGLRHAYKNRPHKHFDVLNDDVYVHSHKHGKVGMPEKRVKVTPFILLAIFVMGPSEPLIPLLFYSGTHRSIPDIIVLITVFTITTILTMLLMVWLGYSGYSLIKTEKLERYTHAISGAVVCICGIGMLFFNW